MIDKDLTISEKNKWIVWLKLWIGKIKYVYSDTNISTMLIAQKMKKLSPKIIPREWMLVMAYESAYDEDFSVISELQTLFETPYDDHTNNNIALKYYKKEEIHSSCDIGNSFVS